MNPKEQFTQVERLSFLIERSIGFPDQDSFLKLLFLMDFN